MNSKSDRDRIRQQTAARNALLNILSEAMMDEAEQRRTELDPGDDFEWLFEKHFNLQKPRLQYQSALESKMIQLTLQNIQEFLRDYHTERNLYEQNPMKYNGLKQGDFI